MIVGLLIGGILVAQSMITASKGQSIIKDLQQLDIAIQNFHTKYNALPGDSKGFNGNGNGYVTDSFDHPLVTNIYGPSWGGEHANFWVSLQQGGFTINNVTFTTAIPNDPIPLGGLTLKRLSAKAPTANFPPSKVLGNNAGYFLFPIKCTTGWCSGMYIYEYYIGTMSVVDNPAIYQEISLHALPSGYSQIVDSKLDDGIASSGKITATDSGGCFNGSRYNTDYSFHNENFQSRCFMLIPASF